MFQNFRFPKNSLRGPWNCPDTTTPFIVPLITGTVSSICCITLPLHLLVPRGNWRASRVQVSGSNMSPCTPSQESEKLESLNAELKAQIEELKSQKQQLVYMLNLHRPTCIVRAQNGQTPEDERNLFIQHIKEGTLQDLITGPAGLSHTSVPTSCDHH